MATIGTGQELLVQGRMSQTKQLETIGSAKLNVTVTHTLMCVLHVHTHAHMCVHTYASAYTHTHTQTHTTQIRTNIHLV